MKTSLSKLVGLGVALTMLFAPFTSQARTNTSTTANPASPAQETQPESFHKVIARPGVLDTSQKGITLWHDYGAFALYKVSPATLGQIPNYTRAKIQVMTDMDSILLDAYPFNTQTETFGAIPERFRTAQADGPALHLIQFVGPIKDAWLQAIEEAGAKPVHYIANYGYLVWADGAARARLDDMADTKDFLQFSFLYQPYFKLGASLNERLTSTYNPEETIRVTIQMYDHPEKDGTEQLIADLTCKRLSPWTPILDYQNVTAVVRVGDLETIAARPDVFWIGEYFERELLDEVQNQILAANFDGSRTGPAGPGYLAWLTGYGFSTDPADYPIVDVTDDGIGNGAVNSGDYTLHELGNIANPTRLQYVGNCTSSADGGGPDGHGHINTSIVGGYDTLTGFPYQDVDGFNRGLGVNPYARLAGTRVFDASGFDLSACGNTDTGLIKRVQDSGAQIASNSWGCRLCAGSYDDSSQAFDVGVRDADLTEPGNQELIFVFSAGNAGPSAGTVGTPGNGKNMITVGASENDRPSDEDGSWTDGCGIGPTGADNAMDVIGFSSRGPAPGGRVKPEVIAPGTHIQGTASTHASYNGTSVCDRYRPSGQSIFAASSGTSHSAPAVAGVSSLYFYWLENVYDTTPSPALIKAYMIAHPTYLTGASGNDTLPSNSQGYGMPNMALAFDDTPRYVVNQSELFDNSGETWTFSGNIVDPGKPVRVVMTYTDEPGAIGTSPEINDLNLEVTAGGDTYLGNNFSGQWSVTGGSADGDNNYEAVFLPTGTSGQINVTVTAFNIAGDGVPNTGDATDQDFALVVYNVSQEGLGYLDGTVYDDGGTPAADPISDANVQAVGLTPDHTSHDTSLADGTYRIGLVTDTYTVTVTAYGYLMAEISGVSVVSGTTTTLNIPLTPAAMHVVSGTVTDAATGWPLYAGINILGYPYGTVWTDPETGFYSVTLPGGTIHTFAVSAWADGYDAASRDVGPLTADAIENFALTVNEETCNAPGYYKAIWHSQDFEANNGGYTASGATSWAWGTPSSGPSGAHSGTGLWATNLIGNYSNYEDGYLTSPNIDLSAHSGQSFILSWWQWYQGEDCCDYISVEISNDGGWTWARVYGEFDGGEVNENIWERQTVPLDSSYAVSGFRVRLRFRSDYSITYPGWYVDDITISTTICSHQSGGLVIGNIYDANTNAPLAGATVFNDSGESTTTGTTLDPAVDDSFYTLFSPAGSHTFTATMSGGYGSNTTTVTVVQSDTVRQDFYLSAASLQHDPQTLQTTLLLNESVTLPFTLTNEGGLPATFELQERDRGFQATSSTISAGQSQILSTVETDMAETNTPQGDPSQLVATHRVYAGALQSFAILVYADNDLMPTPNPYVEEALQAMGLSYTAYNDYAGFETALTTGGPWDLVIVSSEYFGMPSSTMDALYNYVATGDGRLIYSYWGAYRDYVAHSLFAHCGVSLAGDYTSPLPVHWWTRHPLLQGVPQFTTMADHYYRDGQYMNAVPGASTALGGYTSLPTGDQGALVIRDDGTTIVNGFDLDENHQDLDDDGAYDGVELYMNEISFVLYGSDVPWLSEDPITGTIAAGGSQVIDITFDAGEVMQPGQYYATLRVTSNDPINPNQTMPVTMTVQPDPNMGQLHGMVTSDRPGGPLENALVEVISSTTVIISGTTDATGSYGPWWPMNGAYTVRVSATGHLTDTQSVGIVAQQTTTHDVMLTLNAPQVEIAPSSFDETLDWSATVIRVMTVTNSGLAPLEFEIREQNLGFTPSAISAGQSQILSAVETDVAETNTPQGDPSQLVATHRIYTGALQSFAILVYADNDLMPTPNPYIEEALQAMGLSYTAYNDYAGFETALTTGGPWDLVIVSSEYFGMPSSTMDALYNYVATGDGRLIYSYWGAYRDYVAHSLFAHCGVSLAGDYTSPLPVHWWTRHPLLQGVPQFTTMADHYYRDGQYMNAVPGASTALGGYTSLPTGDQGALVIRDDGTTIVNGFDLDENHQDLDDDGAYDGVELYMNEISFVLYGSDVPWLSEDPITGTIAADGSQVIDITFDAGEVMQPGQYYATLRVTSNDPINPFHAVPVTMTVQSDHVIYLPLIAHNH
jgi:hypothetical protein